MQRRTEASLFEPVASYVRRKGFRWQQAEVPFYHYRIDLYGFSRVKNDTLAIELKLRKWRRAYEQALIYQLCADLVYIALPLEMVRAVDLQLLSSHGIGLIGISDRARCTQVVPARRSDVIREHYRETYVHMLLEPSR